jgi:hypothetical protein
MILALVVFDHNRPQRARPYACTTIFFFLSFYFASSLGISRSPFLSCPYDRIDQGFPSKFLIHTNTVYYYMKWRPRAYLKSLVLGDSMRFCASKRSQKPKHLPHLDPFLGAHFPILAGPRPR